LLERHRAADGTLSRTSRDGGPAKYDAFLDDYAFLAQALLSLNAASGDVSWRRQATEVVMAMVQRFSDEDGGGFFFTGAGAADLVVRQKVGTDSPLPSGNAVAVMALLALGQADPARAGLAAFAQSMQQHGEGMSAMVQAVAIFLERHPPFRVSAEADDAANRPATPAAQAADVVEVSASWTSPTELEVRLRIEPPYHVYANEPGKTDMPLVATRLMVEAGAADVEVVYPVGRETALEFVKEQVRVYEGEVAIAARFQSPPEATPRVAIIFQVCDDRACLPPVTREVPIGAAFDAT
jgi:hypothetical protein